MKSSERIGKLIFVRHGESIWNVTDPSRGLITRFTGWADVPLTEMGVSQALAAGACLNKFGIKPNAVYTSLLQRSIKTFEAIKQAADVSLFSNATLIRSWRMNERHYGALMGLSKADAAKRMGEANVTEWRRSWSAAPPKLNPEDLREFKHVFWAQPMTIISEPGRQNTIATEKGVSVPESESLEDCFKRALPLWDKGIAPRLLRGETVMIVAHANTIRAMVKHIEGDSVSIQNLREIHIPSAIPLVYSFDLTSTDSKNGSKSLYPVGRRSMLGMRGRYIVTKELLNLHLNKSKSSTEFDEEASEKNTQSKIEFFDLVEKEFKDVLEYTHHGAGKEEPIIITDASGAIISCNDAWTTLCGFANDEILGSTCGILQGPLTSRLEISRIDELSHIGLPLKASLINYRKSGAAFKNEITIIPLYADSASSQNLAPSHFAAKLEKTANLPNYPPLTAEEIASRDNEIALKSGKSAV